MLPNKSDDGSNVSNMLTNVFTINLITFGERITKDWLEDESKFDMNKN